VNPRFHARLTGHRILLNGLTNAAKFCKDGPIVLSLTGDDKRSLLVIKITDSGIGFDEKILPYLLKAFTKTDANSPGAGLGLHTTKSMVETLGGVLELQSKRGVGTVFKVTLPVQFEENHSLVTGAMCEFQFSCPRRRAHRMLYPLWTLKTI
jgi:signal transduction histidine kinase